MTAENKAKAVEAFKKLLDEKPEQAKIAFDIFNDIDQSAYNYDQVNAIGATLTPLAIAFNDAPGDEPN